MIMLRNESKSVLYYFSIYFSLIVCLKLAEYWNNNIPFLIYIPFLMMGSLSLFTSKNIWKAIPSGDLTTAIFGISHIFLMQLNRSTLDSASLYGFFCISFLYFNDFIAKRALPDIAAVEMAIFFLAIIVVFLPHLALVSDLKPGSFYNLIDPNLPTITTVEGPLIASMLFLLSTIRLVSKPKALSFSFFSMCFAAILLILFNRRIFMFAPLASLVIYWLVIHFRFRSAVILVVIIQFVPFFWSLISVYVVRFTELEFVKIFLIRNDLDQILSATGRIDIWETPRNFFTSWKAEYIFGVPNQLLIDSYPELIDLRYRQPHNSPFLYFANGGYYLLFIYFFLLFNFIKTIFIGKREKYNPFLPLLLLLFICSGTESLHPNSFAGLVLLSTLSHYNFYRKRHTGP